MEDKNEIQDEKDLYNLSDNSLNFKFDNLKLTDDKEEEPKVNISLKSTFNESLISSYSNSSNTNSVKMDPNFPEFFISEMSMDQNNISNRPIPSLNTITNSAIFNQNYDSKSLPSKEVPKIINNPNLSETLQMFQNPQASNIKLTKRAILTLLKNQKTTIILQKTIMEAKNDEIKSIVIELKGEYRRIINDKNGNYFCTDLFKICDKEQRITILKELYLYLSDDAINNYASHPIQTLIEFSSSEEEYKLILYSFNDYNKLLLASSHPNGAYVIQKIISRIPERFRQEFNFIFASFIGFVSTQKFGIVVVKKFISETKNEQIVAQMLNMIRNNFMNLARDKYGNYLIQYLLEKWGHFPEGKEIKELIALHFRVLSQIKYSSFICEFFIKLMNENEKIEFIKQLDLNEYKNSNNPYQVRILNKLGIDISSDNNINNINNDNNNINQFQNSIQLPLTLNNNNNFMQDNNLENNFVNLGQNNLNNNNNMRDKYHKYNKNNNNNKNRKNTGK